MAQLVSVIFNISVNLVNDCLLAVAPTEKGASIERPKLEDPTNLGSPLLLLFLSLRDKGKKILQEFELAWRKGNAVPAQLLLQVLVDRVSIGGLGLC